MQLCKIFSRHFAYRLLTIISFQWNAFFYKSERRKVKIVFLLYFLLSHKHFIDMLNRKKLEFSLNIKKNVLNVEERQPQWLETTMDICTFCWEAGWSKEELLGKRRVAFKSSFGYPEIYGWLHCRMHVVALCRFCLGRLISWSAQIHNFFKLTD